MPSAVRQNVTSWLGTAAGTGAGSSDGTCALAHVADEPNSLAGGGADEALLLAAIADGAPGGVDAARQRQVGYDTAVPHPGDQVVLADHAVAIANQKNQEVEDLRLDRDERALATQLAPAGIKNIVLEEEQQLAAPGLPSPSRRELYRILRRQKSRRPQGQIKLASKTVARLAHILRERESGVIRAAIERSYWTQKQYVRVPNQGE